MLNTFLQAYLHLLPLFLTAIAATSLLHLIVRPFVIGGRRHG